MTREEALSELQDAAGRTSEEQRQHYSEWRGGETREDGVITMPWCRQLEPARRLRKAFDVLGYRAEPFDWVAWSGRPKPEWIDAADATELSKLLFAIERGDRFCEGAMAGEMMRGTYQRIAARILQLQSGR